MKSFDVDHWSCCIFVISVSVDKLEAVPILCVERLISPLFCMNASWSVIISQWRTVPVYFVLFGT